MFPADPGRLRPAPKQPCQCVHRTKQSSERYVNQHMRKKVWLSRGRNCDPEENFKKPGGKRTCMSSNTIVAKCIYPQIACQQRSSSSEWTSRREVGGEIRCKKQTSHTCDPRAPSVMSGPPRNKNRGTVSHPSRFHGHQTAHAGYEFSFCPFFPRFALTPVSSLLSDVSARRLADTSRSST